MDMFINKKNKYINILIHDINVHIYTPIKLYCGSRTKFFVCGLSAYQPSCDLKQKMVVEQVI